MNILAKQYPENYYRAMHLLKVGLALLLLLSSGSAAIVHPEVTLTDFLHGSVGSSHLQEIRVYGTELWCGFNGERSNSWELRIEVFSDLKESKKKFKNVTDTVNTGSTTLPDSFADDLMAWKSRVSGGCVVFREGLVVVSVQGTLDFYELLGISRSIDLNLKTYGHGAIEKEVAKMNVIEASKNTVTPIADQATRSNEVKRIILTLKCNPKEEQKPSLISQLVAIGDSSAIPVIIECLDPKNGIITQHRAARALGELKDKRALPYLKTLLDRPLVGNNLNDGGFDESLRGSALRSLINIDGSNEIPLLKGIALNENEYVSVRKCARSAIEDFEQNAEQARSNSK